MNRVLLTGEVGKTLRSAVTNNGTPVTEFDIAVERTNAGGGKSTDFFTVTCWRELAGTVKGLKEGDRVAVCGRLSKRSYERNGEKIWKVEIMADEVDMVKKPETCAQNKEECNYSDVNVSEGGEYELPF